VADVVDFRFILIAVRSDAVEVQSRSLGEGVDEEIVARVDWDEPLEISYQTAAEDL
jgi:hypothetical protein